MTDIPGIQYCSSKIDAMKVAHSTVVCYKRSKQPVRVDTHTKALDLSVSGIPHLLTCPDRQSIAAYSSTTENDHN